MRGKTISHFIPLVGKYMTLSPTPSYKGVWIRGITHLTGLWPERRVTWYMARANLITLVIKRLLTEVGGSLELSQG